MPALRVVNPADEEVVAEVPAASPEDAREAALQARSVQPAWAELTPTARGEVVRAFADALGGRRHEVAETMVREMGKPLTEALIEVDKAVASSRLLAKQVPRWLEDEEVPLGAEGGPPSATVRAEPAGVVAVITPWNFPLWQPLRPALPALLAGNAVVVKPAEETPLTALLMRRCFEEAGMPRGALRILVGGPEAGEALVTAPGVDVVSFTGSVAVGRRIAELAAPLFRRTVLEMGGSDPFLVLHDADVDAAVKAAVVGRFRNAGQICISAKRFYVHHDLYPDFLAGFVAGAEALHVGDPMDPKTEMGPLVRSDLRDQLQRQVDASVQDGARVRTGGKPGEGKGYWYPPTVLDQVAQGMPVVREETFGPVGPVVPVASIEEAVAKANDSDFGLGASVFTRDADLARRVAANLAVGVVAVNDIVHSHPLVPFGGVKHSGLGRELGRMGMLEFCRVKTVTTPG